MFWKKITEISFTEIDRIFKIESIITKIKQNDDFYYLKPDGSTEKIEFDFKNCKGFMGKIYIVSDETFEVIE